MTDKPFDPTKPCRTRNGRAVRILCTDAKDDFPIVALVDDGVGGEMLRRYDRKGMPYADGPAHALVNAPERCARWIPLVVSRGVIFAAGTFDVREKAIGNGLGPLRLALIEVIIEDGRPVDVRLHHVDEASS